MLLLQPTAAVATDAGERAFSTLIGLLLRPSSPTGMSCGVATLDSRNVGGHLCKMLTLYVTGMAAVIVKIERCVQAFTEPANSLPLLHLLGEGKAFTCLDYVDDDAVVSCAATA